MEKNHQNLLTLQVVYTLLIKCFISYHSVIRLVDNLSITLKTTLITDWALYKPEKF